MGFIKNILRNRFLRRNASKGSTSLLPLDRISSALIVIDVEESSFHDCKDKVSAYFKSKGIKTEILYFDFRRVSKDELLLTNLDRTILRKEVSWLGVPPMAKLRQFAGKETDLLVSLVGNGDFPIECVSKFSPAKFKIGRKQLKGNPFDLIVADSRVKFYSSLEAFDQMCSIIEKIQ